MKRVLPAISLLLLAGLLTACGAAAPAESTPEAQAVADSRVLAQGQLQPAMVLDLSFGLGGQVAEVLATEGQTVEAGQVIARLEASPQVQAEVVRAEQSVLDAQQALQALKDGADLALVQARGAEVGARLALEAAESRLTDLKQAREDAPEDLKPTDLQVEQAEAAVALAEAELGQAQDTLKSLKTNKGINPDWLAASEARLASAQAARASAQAALAAAELRAPAAGTLVGLTLQAGERVAPVQSVATLADLTRWVVKTDDLTEIEVVSVQVGQPVTVTLDALPGVSLQGSVEQIATRFEAKRGDITYTVTVALNQADPQARWGMTAAVRFGP